MAASFLFIVALFFSVRGFFLGFAGVIARLLGVMSGYFIAYSYRAPLAELISKQTASDISPMLLQVAAGAGLFFTTLFITGLLVTGFFALIIKLIPASKELLDSQSPGSRVFGAGCNGLLGASLVLIALWGYGLFVDSSKPADKLQQIANHFGNSLLAVVSQLAGDENNTKTTGSVLSSHSREHSSAESSNAGIISTLNNKSVANLETIRNFIKASSDNSHNNDGTAIDLQQLLSNDKIQNLLDDPAIKEMALKQLKDNPEKMLEALNNPQYRKLLEQMEAQPTQ